MTIEVDMLARYIWPQCGFDMPLSGAVVNGPQVDCFWVTCTLDEAAQLAEPQLDALQKRRYQNGVRHGEFNWFSADPKQAGFLVARDRSRILALPWIFPTSDARASTMQAIGSIGEDGVPTGTSITSLDDLSKLSP